MISRKEYIPLYTKKEEAGESRLIEQPIEPQAIEQLAVRQPVEQLAVQQPIEQLVIRQFEKNMIGQLGEGMYNKAEQLSVLGLKLGE